MTTNTRSPIVAVIDDDADFRQIARGLLEHQGFQVVEAGERESIGTLVAKQELDCMLLDYNLGSDTGFSVLEQLRASPNSEAPVVMLTAAQEQQVAVKAFRSGISDFLSKKNLRAQGLGDAIRSAIDERRQELLARSELDRLRREAAFDPVTGFMSANEFGRRVEEVHRNAVPDRPCGLVAVRVLFHSEVLRRYGQRHADELKRQAANRLKATARFAEQWGSLGNGTMACLVDRIEGPAVLEELSGRASEALTFQFRIAAVTVSIGADTRAAVFSADRSGPDEWLREVVAEMAAAEDSGRESNPARTQAPDSVASTGETERRRHRRTRTLKAAKILIGPSTIDCTMRDVSEAGARLRLPRYTPLASRFSVYFPETGMRRPAALRWQNGVDLGVEFIADD